LRIGIVAPSCRIDEDVAARVSALAEGRAELVWHPQCFLSDGHFAGPDRARAEALIQVANDPAIDAVWFARGGYGACRIVDQVIDALGAAAARKTYLGYSDAGTLLGALYSRGIGRVAHGPMPSDIRRGGGEAAVGRALDWLVHRAPEAVEPHGPAAAFNIVILAHLVGTRHLPDLSGHVLMLEEVAEYLYRTDRDLAQIVQHPSIRGVAGIRIGRISQVPDNDPDFGAEPEGVVRFWCERSGIPFLGRADIGHDADNKVVPFGRLPQPA
jgi:muramoyltetrapeptide carboxypeptidase